MKKIYNNSIKITFTTLAVLALGLVVAPVEIKAAGYQASAGYGGYISYGPSEQNYNQSNYQNNPAPIYAPIPTPVYNTAPVMTVVYSNTNTGKTTAVKKTTVAKKTTTNTTNTAVAKATTPDSNLTANALFGSNSFMPSGIIQWILFAILVLLMVILARKIFGGDQRYHASPMKHS